MVVPTRYNKNESVVSCIVREADKAWRSTGVIVLLVQTYSPWPRGKPVEVVVGYASSLLLPYWLKSHKLIDDLQKLNEYKGIKQILSPIGEYNIKNSVKIWTPRSIIELKEKLKMKNDKIQKLFFDSKVESKWHYLCNCLSFLICKIIGLGNHNNTCKFESFVNEIHYASCNYTNV